MQVIDVHDLSDASRIIKLIRKRGYLAKVVIIVYSDTKDVKVRGFLGGLKSAYRVDIKKAVIIA